MSDPLSILASVIGLAAITAKIARNARQLYTSGKGAPTSIHRISEEMDQLHLIFGQVQMLLQGHVQKTPSKSRLDMLPLHHLLTTLSGCVLAYSDLDKKLSEVASATTRRAVLGTRVWWALWKEAEASVILVELERHKSSLHMMLTIIQCETMEEASQQLASLHEQIGKISESISESHREVAVQLRELIGQRHDAENETSAVSIHPTTHQATSTEYSLHISPPSTTVSNNSRFDGIDSASIRTTSSFLTIRSVRSLIPSWSEELKKSRPYKRLWRHSSSSSVFSKDSSATKGVTWSMLSNMSLGDLPISEISVLELPISPSDLYDPIPYQQWVGHKQIRQEVNWSRLEGAIDNYNPYAFQALLNLGTDPGKEEVVYSPLPVSETSCRYHGIAFCKLLLDLQVDRKDFDGSTPLSLAAVHATDFSGRTPLSHAAKLGIFSVCKLLLDRGAMVDAADYSGRTPLSYAAWYGHIHICELLLDRGANVDTADCGGRTTLSYSVRRHVYEDLCVLLLNRGAAVDAADSSGRTPLSHGVGLGTVSLCELLLRWGAAVNSTDSNGRTPLSYCAELNGHSYVCALLLDWGGKVDLADFKGRTPLSYSTERGVSSISRKLLDRGANADAADFKGHTPLWYAQSWGEESEIYEMLWMFRCLCANQTTVDVDRDNRPINDSVE